MRFCFVPLIGLIACTRGGGDDAKPTVEETDSDSEPIVETDTDAEVDTDSDTTPPPNGPELRVEGAWFVDRDDGAVLLRGLNVAGDSKVPPYVPLTDPALLDPLQASGVNVIRLVFNWEAYEGQRGVYNDAYLLAMVDIAEWAWDRKIYTIVDFHQDGFSRYVAGGCGDGFPEWAHPTGTSLDVPNNGAACVTWAIQMSLDPRVHASFGAFYGDDEGVRTAFLELWERVALAFEPNPGVIGYDVINEPWGFESSELAPLYDDAEVAIRSAHPDAILFIEGHVTTNGGIIQTTLPKPSFGNFAYAPHFYDALVLVSHTYLGVTLPTDNGFATMSSKAAEWNVPLFVGEFGTHGDTFAAPAYMDLQYERMDERLASGAQWNYTPGWTPTHKDGWNDEDLSIVDDAGVLRPNWRARAYPMRVAGIPESFSAIGNDVQLTFAPTDSGDTVIFVPSDALWGVSPPVIQTTEIGATCAYEEPTRTVRCSGFQAGTAAINVHP